MQRIECEAGKWHMNEGKAKKRTIKVSKKVKMSNYIMSELARAL